MALTWGLVVGVEGLFLNEFVKSYIEQAWHATAHYPRQKTSSKPMPNSTVKQVRLTNDEISQLVEDYKSGHSVKDLVDKWGIHRGTVADHLNRNNVNTRPATRKLTNAQVTRAAKMYRAGKSLAKLGTHFDVSPTTMRKELHSYGVIIRPRN